MYLELVLYLIEKGADINKKYPKKYCNKLTPLQFIFRELLYEEHIFYNIAKAIIEKNTNANKKSSGNELTDFQFLLANDGDFYTGKLELLKLLIEKGADSNKYFPKKKYYYGLSPLEYFLYLNDGVIFDNESYEFCKLLIEKGADINKATGKKNGLSRLTAFQFIMVAYIVHDANPVQEKLAIYCINNGGNIDQTASDQMMNLSVFQFYIYEGLFTTSLELTTIMIEKTKQINEPTPLSSDLSEQSIFEHFIGNGSYTEKNRVDVTIKFLEHGADVNHIPEGEGELNEVSAFQHLVANKVWKIKRGEEIIKKCIENNANITRKDVHGKTPLDYTDADTPKKIIEILTPK